MTIEYNKYLAPGEKLLKVHKIKNTMDFFKYLGKLIHWTARKQKIIYAILQWVDRLVRPDLLCNAKTAGPILSTIAKLIRDNMIYRREPPGFEMININIPYILKLKNGKRWRGDCDDAVFVLSVILLVMREHYKLPYDLTMVFTSHVKGKPLHHTYLIVGYHNGPSEKSARTEYLLDIVRKDNNKLPVYEKIQEVL